VARICFFARVADPAVLDRVEFYAQDLRALRELGHDVRIATRVRDLVPADLYFCWWWTWSFAPITLARVLRKPAIVTGVFDMPSWDTHPPHEKLLMRSALLFADANIFDSHMERAQIPELFRTRNPAYVPHGVDTTLYHPGTDARERTIFSVGWLQYPNAERKGMFDLVRAAPLIHEAYPDVRFLVAGDKGTAYPPLQRLVHEVGASPYIDFAGAISREEKIRCMQQCAVYLQPSRHEGFGVAILEAMSCGAPIVTRSVGAVPEVVGDTAVMAASEAPEAIAAAVNGLLADPDGAATLGARARQRAVSCFPYERRRDELKPIIDALLASRKSDP
jgi:glycosyltransferase involved in cell wall biosynthesis